MKIKILILCSILLTFTLMGYKINNTEMNKEVEIQENKPKETEKPKETKKVEKTEEEKELEHWSNVTGKEVIEVNEISCQLTFYTDLLSEYRENGVGLTYSGIPARHGVIANNYYPQGTNLYLEGMGEFQVLDKGGGFNSWTKFDVFIERLHGENDEQYHQRVMNMGVKNVTGYILKFEEELNEYN